jgi:hypothetical protein
MLERYPVEHVLAGRAKNVANQRVDEGLSCYPNILEVENDSLSGSESRPDLPFSNGGRSIFVFGEGACQRVEWDGDFAHGSTHLANLMRL